MAINASTAGLRVLRSIIDLPPAKAGAELNRVQPYLQQYEEDRKTFDFIRSHLAQHGQAPHSDTILDKISVFLPQSLEPYEFEVAQLKERFIRDAMHSASDKANELLQAGKAGDALSTLISDLLPITQGHMGHVIKDLRKTEVLEFYHSQLAGTAPPITKFGYPTIDLQGGIEGGDMLAVVGRPASGKTWIMLNTAVKYWAENVEPVMFVTQEMGATQIEKRALPMIAGVSPTPLYQGKPIQYQIGHDNQPQYLEKLAAAKAMAQDADAPFLIYDSKMAGTVHDIEAIAAMHGVKKVWIDGAYMLRHPDPRLGRYQRVPENLDLMKQWTMRADVFCASSWQFKRGAGKNDMDTPDLDDIGYSHAIGEYMTVIMGLLDDPKSVNQMSKKRVTLMKGRNGETGGFDIHFDFAKMNFDEILAEETGVDLQFL